MHPKVLFFADWYLPGRNGGGAVTALANLVALLGHEFKFYVITRDRDAADAKPYADLPLDHWVPVGRAQVLYTSDLGFRNIRRRIREVAPDVIYLGSFFSRFTIRTLFLRRLGLLPPLPVVLAPQGEFGCGALTLKRLRKRAYLELALHVGLCRNLLWHAVSELEDGQIRRKVSAKAGSATVRVAHTALSPVLLQREADISKPEKRPEKGRFVFLSRIARNKNLQFALDLIASVPGQVDFDIYGPVDDGRVFGTHENPPGQCQSQLFRAHPLRSRGGNIGRIRLSVVAHAR
jgi:glycosyltransferase involved in cell wall biosynthesis